MGGSVKPVHIFSLTVWQPWSGCWRSPPSEAPGQKLGPGLVRPLDVVLRMLCPQPLLPWSPAHIPSQLSSHLLCLPVSNHPGRFPHLKVLILIASAKVPLSHKAVPQVQGLGPGCLWRPPHQSGCRKGSVTPRAPPCSCQRGHRPLQTPQFWLLSTGEPGRESGHPRSLHLHPLLRTSRTHTCCVHFSPCLFIAE